MRNSIKILGLSFWCAATFPAYATLVEIPYTSGKKAGTVVITKVSNVQMSPDTLKIGMASIRLSLKTDVLPAVCGAKPTIVAQFIAPFGGVFQTADTSDDWNAYATMPASGLIAVDSVNILKSGSPDPAWRAPGFDLFSEGPGNSCTGMEYFMAPRWNRVVFMRMGSGVDYRLKVSFQVKSETYEAPTPMIQNSYLNSLTLHYVINANSTDVNGAPVSLQPRFAFRSVAPSLDWKSAALYNPLGVRLKREARPREVVIPLRR
jgi:hypothetical protein